jgi:presenilin-like A22 family membrane protease
MNALILDVVSQYFSGFSRFDPYGGGWYGFIVTVIIFYLFLWVGKRGNSEDVNKDIADELTPAFVITMFMALFNFPTVIIGWAMIIIWLVTLKYQNKMKNSRWVVVAVGICLNMGMGMFLSPVFGFTWAITLMTVLYIKNELKLRKKRRLAKNAPPAPAPAKK